MPPDQHPVEKEQPMSSQQEGPSISRRELQRLTQVAIARAETPRAVRGLQADAAEVDYLWPKTLWIAAHAGRTGDVSIDPAGALLDCLVAAAVPDVLGPWINEGRTTRIAITEA